MEDFTIRIRLTKKEYATIFFIGLYKKTVFIASTILGLYFVVTVLLDYYNIISYYSEKPLFEIYCGIILLLAPTLIVLMVVSQFNSNPFLKNEIEYTFGESGIIIKGITFKSEIQWSHIIKQKELGNYLILSHTKKLGNIINKKKLTIEQLQFIKAKVNNK